MNRNSLFFLLTLVALPFISFAQESVYKEFSAEVELEYRYFPNAGLYEGQEQSFLSIAAQPEFYMDWKGGKNIFKVSLFGRIDQHDQRRTHFDIRELYWQTVKGNAELTIGIKKVFWGVTESAHLVDIINQSDVIESFDNEKKLGQPMVHYSYLSSVGTFDFFVMPFYRKRVFPGTEGRLRTPVVLDGNEFPFESSMEEWRTDFAVRWSHYIGKFDFGISHFYGTGREPLIASIEPFQPVYGIINQTGLDVQATTGPVLWKFEGIYNANSFKSFGAIATGFEYTFGNVNGKGLDIGLVGEYLYDSRRDLTLSSLQNDIFAGVRFGFNDIQDTQILAGTIIDLDRTSKLYSIEASRRVGQSWGVELEGRFFQDIQDNEFMYFFREDSFLRFAITKYF